MQDEHARLQNQINEELAKFGRLLPDSEHKLQDVNTGINNSQLAIEQAIAALGGLKDAVGKTIVSAYKGAQGAEAFAGAADGVATAADSAGDMLITMGGPLGIVAGIAMKIVGKLIKLSKVVAEQAEAEFKGYQKMSQIGAVTAKGLTGVAEGAQKIGIGVQDLNAYFTQLQAHSKDLAGLGGTVAQGREKFEDITKAMEPYRLQLLLIGSDQEAQNEATLDYVSELFQNNRIRGKTDQQIAEGAKEKIIYEQKLTMMTGTTRKEREEARRSAQAEGRYEAKLRQMELAGDQVGADRARRFNAALVSVSPGIAEMYRHSITGNLDTEKAQQYNRNTLGEGIAINEKVANGTMSVEDAVTKITGKFKQTNDNIGVHLGIIGRAEDLFGAQQTQNEARLRADQDITKAYKTASNELIDMGAENGKAKSKLLQDAAETRLAQQNTMLNLQKTAQAAVPAVTSAMNTVAQGSEKATGIINKTFLKSDTDKIKADAKEKFDNLEAKKKADDTAARAAAEKQQQEEAKRQQDAAAAAKAAQEKKKADEAAARVAYEKQQQEEAKRRQDAEKAAAEAKRKQEEIKRQQEEARRKQEEEKKKAPPAKPANQPPSSPTEKPPTAPAKPPGGGAAPAEQPPAKPAEQPPAKPAEQPVPGGTGTPSRQGRIKKPKDATVDPNSLAARLQEHGFSRAAIANILAQVQGESGFRPRSEEIAKYSAKTMFSFWGPPGAEGGQPTDGKNTVKFKTLAEAQKVHDGDPVVLGDLLYGGRFGNDKPGDGFKYRGRGLIGVTFKDNYKYYGDYLAKVGYPKQDLLANPDLVNDPEISQQLVVAFFKDKDTQYDPKKKGGAKKYDLEDLASISKAVGFAGGKKEVEKRAQFAKEYSNDLEHAASGGVFQARGASRRGSSRSPFEIMLKGGAVPVNIVGGMMGDMPRPDSAPSSVKLGTKVTRSIAGELRAAAREVVIQMQSEINTEVEEAIVSRLAQLARAKQTANSINQRLLRSSMN